MADLSHNNRPLPRLGEDPNRNHERRQRKLPVSRGAAIRVAAPPMQPNLVIASRLGPALRNRFRVVVGDEYRLIGGRFLAPPAHPCPDLAYSSGRR